MWLLGFSVLGMHLLHTTFVIYTKFPNYSAMTVTFNVKGNKCEYEHKIVRQNTWKAFGARSVHYSLLGR